jgi:hypothetical protein
VVARKVGSTLVAISCPASLKKDAAPTLATPRVNHAGRAVLVGVTTPERTQARP